MNKITETPLKENGATSPGPSHLEQQFPRIAARLVDLWQARECKNYLSSLLIDDRGGRQGFPSEVIDELMMLDQIHWGQSVIASPDSGFTCAPKPKPGVSTKKPAPSQSWLKRIFSK